MSVLLVSTWHYRLL